MAKVPLMPGTRRTVKFRLITVIVVIGLVATYASYETVTSSTYPNEIYSIPQSTIQSMVNGTGVQFVQSASSVPYYVVKGNDSNAALGLIYLTTDVARQSSYGYSGPIGVLVYVNTNGTILSIRMWQNPDSFSFLITQSWLNGFVGRSVFETMTIGVDVTPMSHATYSSTGITGGVRDGGRTVVNSYNNVVSASNGGLLGVVASIFASMDLRSLILTFGLIGLYIGAVLAFIRDDNRIKYGVFAGAIAILGVYATRLISISDVNTFMTLTPPPITSNLPWFLLYGGAIGTSFVWGRIYCGYICPYGVFTEIIHKLSPVKRVMPRRIHDKLVNFKYINAVLVVAGVFIGVSFLDYEPFATLFLLRGDTIAWVVLGSLLVLSLFYYRFYCSYICPVGVGLALVGRLRVREINRWPECKTCKVCQTQCCMQAIHGPKISAVECMNCRGCEEEYSDFSRCPHYALERAAQRRMVAPISPG
jgi:NosR/NirI family transcriptional regulator, nitrous oxide reductase regulator